MNRGGVPARTRVRVLALATVGYVASFAAWTVLGPLLPLLQAAYRLSAVETSALAIAPVLVGALVRIPAGIAADRYGSARVFAVLLLATAVVAVLATMADSYPGWLVAAAALGLVAGGTFAVGVPLIVAWFPPGGQGAALGVFGMGNAGGALAGWSAPAIASAWGVHAVLIALAVPLVALAALLLALPAPPGTAGATSGTSVGGSIALLWREPVSGVLGFFSLVTFGGYLGLVLHLPVMLVATYDMTLAEAGARVAALSVTATLARPVGGFASDRLGGARVLIVVFPVIAALALVLSRDPARFLVTPLLLALGGALGAGNGAGIKLVPVLFPRRSGTVGGLVGAVGALGGLALPLAQGLAGDLVAVYAFCFTLLAVLAVVALVLDLAVIVRRTS